MPKPRPVEDTLAELAALRGSGPGVLAEVLPKYLSSKSNLVVARAADMAGKAGAKPLEHQLTAAFHRFMENPAKSDPGCFAKKAIVEALYELGVPARDVFLAGIKHVQPEPRWGGDGDTAAEVRGLAAMGLVRIGYPDVMNELVELLVDPSHQARILAARALAYTGCDKAALLLRLKILAGDNEPDVNAECIVALASLERTRALDFVKRYLHSPDESLSAAAALALGEMRHPAALAPLLERWQFDPTTEARQTLVLPIALSRLPESVDFLLKAVADAKEPLAVAIVEALRIYRHDDATRDRLRAAVTARNADRLTRTFEEHFNR